MDGARLSSYPQLSWLRFFISYEDAATFPLEVENKGACHTLSLTFDGHHDVRWITAGRETRYREEAGTVHFFPADGRHHTFSTTMSAACRTAVLLLPRHHLSTILESEGLHGRLHLRRILAPSDAVLQQSMARLTADGDSHRRGFDASLDEVARRLVLRLVQLGGGGVPDWYRDASVFDRRLLGSLVDVIDGQLRQAPSVSELAPLTGLSPSHFARKFRHSTGLSLARFVNRRRIAAAMPLLRPGDDPIAKIAERLGFSSQSHFTRVFSGMTGMTPSRFRRLFRPGAR